MRHSLHYNLEKVFILLKHILRLNIFGGAMERSLESHGLDYQSCQEYDLSD